MKLTRQTVINSLCPICALGGITMPLSMSHDSLVIRCLNGHLFDTIELSKLAARVGKRDTRPENTNSQTTV